MPDLSGIRTALLEFAEDSKSPALPLALGLQPITAPTDLLQLPSQPIAKPLSTVASGLFRVGSAEAPEGNVGMYVVPLHEWGQRSSDRDRARRRVAKALVEYAPYGDRRWFVALTNGTNHEVEFILPRVREGKAGVSTVRALVQPTDPSGFHVRLLTDLALTPGMSLLDISRKWSEAFSVERVTKAFYQEFRDLRNHLSEELIAQNKGQPLLSKENRGEVDRFVTRQLGRMLFLWFLQEKRWLDGNRLFFEELFKRYCGGASARNFYKDLLVPLFFDTLAYPKGSKQRAEANELFGDIPYLNGGLFLMTPYEVELLGENRERLSDIDFPNGLFDPRLHDNGRSPTVLGLLKNYRFTTRESTPDDMSVDPDPELLGRVFENLNEERQRHDTGTYYTPREIVQFMCREALDGYLQDAASVDRPLLERLRAAALEDEPPEERLAQPVAKKLVDALDAVKVCDPAVGSGAFLVGAMQEIILLRRGIAHSSTPFRDPDASEVAVWKRHVISNALYGVDISPEAVGICQLRLWLSLVLEEEQPEPLPNLDFRIVAGDSLIDRAGDIAFEDSIPRPVLQYDLETHERLEHLRKSIAALRDEFAEERDPRRARRLRRDIRERQLDIVRLQFDRHIETAKAEVAATTAKRNEAERLAAPERTLKQRIRAAKEAWEKVTALTALRDGLEEDASYRKLFLWPVEFPEVFAKDRGGFDIVLANPPWVRQEKLSALDQKAYELAFPEVYAGTADLLVFFYARALQIVRERGHLSFITSNKFMRADYGVRLRGLLTSSFSLRILVDFAHLPVFDADTMPLVLVATRTSPGEAGVLSFARVREDVRVAIVTSGRAVTVSAVREQLEALPELLERTRIDGIPQTTLRTGVWAPVKPLLRSCYSRLKSGHPLLRELVGSVASTYGVKTGLNEAYVIDMATRDRLVGADARTADVVKSWLRGQDITRWRPTSADLFLILIPSSNDERCTNPWRHLKDEAQARSVFEASYPAVFEHLSKFEAYPSLRDPEKLEGLRYRSDQGRFWWELRSCTYYSEFEKPKVVWRDISYVPQFAWDESAAYCGNTCFFSASAPKWVVPICNSAMFTWLASMALFEAKDAYFRWLPSDLADIPVPHPTKELRRRFEVLVDLAAGSPEAIDAESNDLVFRLYGVEGVERSEIELWYGKRLQAETVRSALAFTEETPVHGTAPEDRLEET